MGGWGWGGWGGASVWPVSKARCSFVPYVLSGRVGLEGFEARLTSALLDHVPLPPLSGTSDSPLLACFSTPPSPLLVLQSTLLLLDSAIPSPAPVHCSWVGPPCAGTKPFYARSRTSRMPFPLLCLLEPRCLLSPALIPPARGAPGFWIPTDSACGDHRLTLVCVSYEPVYATLHVVFSL